MKLNFFICRLHPRRTFRISRAAKREVANVIVELEDDGVIGRGEASPNPFYGETAELVAETLSRVRDGFAGLEIRTPEDIAGVWNWIWPRLAPSRAAQCAVDLALWEWLALSRGVSVCELALGQQAAPVLSFGTLGIMEPQELREALGEFERFERIKIKAGENGGLAAVREVRNASGALLAVDANAALTAESTVEFSREYRDCGVTFLEQPLAPGCDWEMPGILARSPLPVIADESCVEESDVERMPGAFSGFNIKLVKCGGLTPGLRMLRRGRELGLTVMVGCMLETSLLISAGAVIGQKTDYADLDGAWLLADDPFSGMRFQDGVISPANAPGWGCRPKLPWPPDPR